MSASLIKVAAARQSAWPASIGRNLAVVLSATVLVALCAHISIPLGFTPVPVTMLTFAVLLLGLLLSPATAFSALALYLVEGAAGLPVFSPGGPGGLAHLLGPTGGYLLASPLAAALVSQIYRRLRGSVPAAVLAVFAGGVLMLGSGACWLAVLAPEPWTAVLTQSIAPFLPGDAFKAGAAAMAGAGFRRLRREK